MQRKPRSGRMERGGTTLKDWRPFGKVRMVDASREWRARGGGVRRDGGIRGKRVREFKVGAIRGIMGECDFEAFRENIRPFMICHGGKQNTMRIET